ncbi:hypothetical protein Aperf_G00000028055 [Anoplocephala perfoliata]
MSLDCLSGLRLSSSTIYQEAEGLQIEPETGFGARGRRLTGRIRLVQSRIMSFELYITGAPEHRNCKMKTQKHRFRNFLLKLCCCGSAQQHSRDDFHERPHQVVNNSHQGIASIKRLQEETGTHSDEAHSDLGTRWNEIEQDYPEANEFGFYEDRNYGSRITEGGVETSNSQFKETHPILRLFPPGYTDWIPQGLTTTSPTFCTPNEDTVAKCNCIIFQILTRQSKCERPSDWDIRKHFFRFGRVVAFKGKHSDGYVVFEKLQQAQKALEASDHVVNGCRLKVIPAFRDLSGFSSTKNSGIKNELSIHMARSELIHFQALLRFSKTSFPPIDAIQQHFQKFGKVVKIVLNQPTSGLLLFKTLEEAERTLSAPEHVIKGCVFKVVSCKDSTKSRFLRNETAKCIFFEVLNKETNCLPPSNRALREHFQQFGKIEEFNRRKGYIDYKTSREATRALSAPEHVVNGCKLKVSMATTDRFIHRTDSQIVRASKSGTPIPPLMSIQSSQFGASESSVIPKTGNWISFEVMVTDFEFHPNLQQTIYTYFLQCGKVADIVKSPQGFSGYVAFSSESEALRVVSRPMHSVMGFPMRVALFL